MTTENNPSPPGIDVNSPQVVPPPINVGSSVGLDKKGPSGWKSKLRPVLSVTPSHEDRLHQLQFDAFFGGAKVAGKWEEDWPLMTKEEFIQALDNVAEIEVGGHNPDGSHPRVKSKE